MTEKRGDKLEGLSLEDKRKRWRAAPQRLFWKMAAASGADVRFKRRIAIAAGKHFADKSLRFHVPFAIAERALGEPAPAVREVAIRWISLYHPDAARILDEFATRAWEDDRPALARAMRRIRRCTTI